VVLWIALGIGLLVLLGLVYWQLVLAEGVYLGRRVVVALYDIAARGYDHLKGYEPQLEDYTLGQPLAERLGDDPEVWVLDVGTGTGRMLLSLMRVRAFHGHAVGLDPSAGMLRRAVRNLAPHRQRVALVRQEAGRLPFSDAAFDAVCCIEAIEFTTDPVRTLHEFVRVLKPGGTLLFTQRIGTEALFLPGRVFRPLRLAQVLADLPLEDIQVLTWEMNYDQVWARRRS
jgi:SAM-dependent methyltransferase